MQFCPEVTDTHPPIHVCGVVWRDGSEAPETWSESVRYYWTGFVMLITLVGSAVGREVSGSTGHACICACVIDESDGIT